MNNDIEGRGESSSSAPQSANEDFSKIKREFDNEKNKDLPEHVKDFLLFGSDINNTRLSEKFEEDRLLVQKNDGHYELEEELKKTIVNAFKESPSHEPRIFGSKDKIGQEEEYQKEQEEKTAAAVVKMIGEERKLRRESLSNVSGDTPVENLGVREEILKKLEEETPTIAIAEILMVKGTNYALGLNYAPDMLPIVVAKGKKEEAKKLIQYSFRIDLPVLEVPNWDTSSFDSIEVGKEISENLYPIAAEALAQLYRTRPGAYLVRFVKPEKIVRSRKKSKLKKVVDEKIDLLDITPLSVEISEILYPYREELEKQIDMTTNRLINELGLIIPAVKIRQSSDLVGGEYIIKIKEVTYDVGMMDLEMEVPDVFYHLQSRLRAIIYTFGYELLGYKETEALVNRGKKHNPSLYKSLFPYRFSLGALRYILRGLLKESIPIKDIVTILETIDDHIRHTGDPNQLIEYIRSAFSQFITNCYRGENGCLNVIMLSPSTEQKIMASIKENMGVRWLELDQSSGLDFLKGLSSVLKSVEVLGVPVVILVSPAIRRFIRNITEYSYPEIAVLSYSEVAALTPVTTVGVIQS